MKTRNIRRPLAKTAVVTAAGLALTSAAASAQGSGADDVVKYEAETGESATIVDNGSTTAFTMDDGDSVAFKKDGGFTHAAFTMDRKVVAFTMDDGDSVAFKKPDGLTAFSVAQESGTTYLREG
jgi:hypothetical protein